MAQTRNISEVHFYMERLTEWSQFKDLEAVKTYYASHMSEYLDTFAQMGGIQDEDVLDESNLFVKLFLRAKNTHDIFVSNPKRHFEDILKQKGFILNRVVEKVNKRDHINLKEVRAAVKDKKMSKYISVVEGTCDDKAFVKAVEERFELTGVETTEDKLAFKDILFDNNRLKEHFCVSNALSTPENLERALSPKKATLPLNRWRATWPKSNWCG